MSGDNRDKLMKFRKPKEATDQDLRSRSWWRAEAEAQGLTGFDLSVAQLCYGFPTEE
jgi:hypothetical protein